MDITTTQLLLIFIVACFCGMDSVLDEFQLHRPLIACTLTGLILGDIKQGIILGGLLEIVALSWMNVGAAMAPDSALASMVSTILVIAGGQSNSTAIAFAIPIAALGQVLTVIVRSITVSFQHLADKAASQENLQAINRLHISALMLQGLRVAIPVVMVGIFVGTSQIQLLLDSIPKTIINGLDIAGGIIVVVGYAMVINMISTRYLMPFFYLGFVVAAFTQFNLVGLGILGTVLALVYLQLSPKYYVGPQNTSIPISNKHNQPDNDDELD